jgi:hypothetical protein
MWSVSPVTQGAVDRGVRRRGGADHRADVDDAAARAEVLDRLLRGQDQAKDVQVEQLVEVLGRHLFERRSSSAKWTAIR